MGIIKDIVHIAGDSIKDDVKGAINDVGIDVSVEKAMRSISAEASKATYYFPVLVSNTVMQKDAFMISDNLQYMYAYFIRACFALTPAIKTKLKEGETLKVEEYLKRFHKNMGITSRSGWSVKLESVTDDFSMFPNEPLNEVTYNDYMGQLDKIQEKEKEIFEARQKDREDERKDRKEKEEKQKKDFDLETSAARWSPSAAEKANATAPLVVPVTCTFLVDTHELKVNFPVGIKTIIHGIDYKETADRLISEILGHGFRQNLIRWKSGEIESLSDAIFGLDQMRKDIYSDSELSKWMDIVTKRKILNKLSIGALSKKPFLPNMSIVISMDDVDYIERTTNINLLKQVRFVYKLMKECLLLSFVIVDNTNETAWILYDGHGSFEEVPFSAIKRDSDKQKLAIDRLLKVFA